MDTVDVLLATRDLIADPEHWTCAADARAKAEPDMLRGPKVSVHSDKAYSFCLRGAVAHVTGYELRNRFKNAGTQAERDYYRAMTVLSNQLRGWEVVGFNDSNDHSAVMDLLDRTIRYLKGL